MNLKGKVAVISGGASGLGLAAARRFISVSYTHLTLPTSDLV